MASPIRLNDDLQKRVDAARGLVPREPFVRQLISEALDTRAGITVRTSAPKPTAVLRQHHPRCSCAICKPPKAA